MAKLDPWNFLTLIKDLVTGGGLEADNKTAKLDSGYVHDVNYPLQSLDSSVTITDSTGGMASATFAAITAPAANATTSLTADMTAVKNALAEIALQLNARSLEASETNLLVQSYAASTTAMGSVTFVVPRDYDEATDTFLIHLGIASGGSTDTPTISAAAYKKTPGSAAATVATGVSGTAVGGTTALALTSAEQVMMFQFSNKGLKRNDAVTITFTAGAHTTDTVLVYYIQPTYRSTLVSYAETDGANAETGNRLR